MTDDTGTTRIEVIPPDDDGLDLFLALYPEIAITFVVLALLDREGDHHA